MAILTKLHEHLAVETWLATFPRMRQLRVVTLVTPSAMKPALEWEGVTSS